MSDNNFNEDTTNDLLNEGSNLAREVGKKATRGASKGIKQGIRKATKKTGKAIVKAGVKTGKAIAKALLTTLKLLLPYIAIIGAILGVVVLGYFIIFEFTGTEKEYIKKYENEIEMTSEGIYKTSEAQMNGENKIIRDFYRYFAGQSFWKLINDDNENLIAPDDREEVKDYYGREESFKLPANLLYSLDDYMFNWTWKYPEQFIKPVQFDKEELKLMQLTDEDRLMTAESEEQDIETGEKTGKEIISMRDYGLGSVLKYNEKDDYKKKMKVVGEYVSMDVWNHETKSIDNIPITEEFDIEMKDGVTDIWLIDKAILFNGNIEFIYEEKQVRFDDLEAGETRDEREAKKEYIYETYWEKTFTLEEQFNEDTGQMELVEVPGPSIPHDLKKYRSEESAVFEELPTVVDTITDDQGQRYFEDYLYNFETYAPIDIMEDFEFEDRIDYDSYIFDYDGFLTDDYGLNLGSNIESDSFKKSFGYKDIVNKYSSQFGVDPFLILAMMAQESGGNSKLNSDGLMQITGGPREVSARNANGQMETFTIQRHEKQDPDKSIHWGVMYFKAKLDEYDGNPYKAIQSYNFGSATMKTIRDMNPEAWDSEYGWLIYREGARRKHAPSGKSSANYSCMAFPEGTMPVIKGNLWGNSCHLEMVMQYYGGGEIEMGESTGESAWDKVVELGNKLSNAVMKFIKKREPDEIIPKFEFVNHVGDTRVQDILMTTKALDNQILFSETNNEGESVELSFWEEGFMDTIGAIGMSLQELLDIAPNADGYLPPIDMTGLRVSSYFGPRVAPVSGASPIHKGVDVAAPIGTPVYAIADGKVSRIAPMNGKAGNMLVINHGNGVETIYMHLDKFNVEVGQEVPQGWNVAQSGVTGLGTGPHLHFEFKLNGVHKDPLAIILGE